MPCTHTHKRTHREQKKKKKRFGCIGSVAAGAIQMLRGPWQLRSARRSHLTEQRQNNDNNKGIVDNNNEQSPSTLTQTQFGMGEVWSRRWALKNAQKIVCKKFKRGIFAHAQTNAHTYTQTLTHTVRATARAQTHSQIQTHGIFSLPTSC